MTLSPHQFTSHVKGPHGFAENEDKPLVWGPNTGDKTGPHAITSMLIDQSERQLRELFHEPGWDMQYKQDTEHNKDPFSSAHGFEMPEEASFGHTEASLHDK